MSKLIILRGLPSAGKSTLALTLVPEGRDIATDDFFHTNFDRSTPYVFDFEKIRSGAAHGWAEGKVRELLSDGTGLPVCLANTNSMRWEFEAYIQMCLELEVPFEVIDLYDGGLSDSELHARNTHDIPLEVWQRMRDRWEHDWENADIRKPWLRS